MLIDVIIISCAIDDNLKKITQECLNSLRKSANNVCFRPIVVESSDQIFDCETIHISENLNYNKFLNIGFEKSKSDFVSFCNNDIIFMKGWMESHIEVFSRLPNIDSLSPFCQNFHERKPNCHECFKRNSLYFGFRSRYELTGWCFTTRRKTIEKIQGFDSSVDFWYSDDAYARQLQKAGLVHALDTTASIVHLFGSTTKILSTKDKAKYTYLQEKKFKKDFL